MRIGFVQFTPAFGRVEGNLAAIERLLKGVRADLVVLPELCTTGYCFTSRREAILLAETTNGPSFRFLQNLARQKRMAIVAGLAEKSGRKTYNSASLFTPDGAVGIYRKAHLFNDEKRWFAPGDTGFRVFQFGNVRLGLMVCFDWFFPEAARTLALRGAQIICHPSNLVLPYCPDSMPVRALENRVFTITANRTGAERRGGTALRFIGQSVICGPDAKVLSKAPERGESVQVVEIEPARATVKRVTPLNDLFKDRRPELYACGG